MSHRDELIRLTRERDWLEDLGDQPVRDALDGMKRSLRTVSQAIHVFEAVERRLGDRAVRDWYATPNEQCLLVRDAAHPDWLIPERLVYLQLDLAPAPPPPEPVPLPPWLEEKVPPRAPPAERPAEPVPLAPGGRSGRIHLHEGPANLQITYDEAGLWKESSITCGDHYAFSVPEERPFQHDPLGFPPPPPPHSVFLPNVPAGGLTPDALAERIVAGTYDRAWRARVWAPGAQPGNALGTWGRARRNLARLAWEGRIPADGGWVVVDGWNGTSLGFGPTFESAVAAWRDAVGAVQPLPPFEPPAPEPTEDPGDDGVQGRRAVFDEEKKTAAFGTRIKVTIHPAVWVEWPEPRPENVSAAAVPVDPEPPIPEGLARAGFDRVLRLFDEYGGSGFAFLRIRGSEIVGVGDEAAPHVDPETLADELARLADEGRRDSAELWAMLGETVREYPVNTTQARVWDPLRQARRMERGTSASSDGFDGRWDLSWRWSAWRVTGVPG